MRATEDELADVDHVAIDKGWLKRLQAIATQLYREERLNGDAQRDIGHALTALVNSAIPVPREAAPKRCEHPGCGGMIAELVCDRCRSF